MKKISLDRPSQRGQAIVLIAFSITVVIGMIALAIDGGRWFAADRHAQNISDNSAIAAAMATCRGESAQDIVTQTALVNGFNDNNTDNWVDLEVPPSAGSFAGQAGYMRVTIRSIVDPLFAQIIFSDTMFANGAATSRCNVTGTTTFDPDKFRGAWANGTGGCHHSISFLDLAGQGYDITGGIHSNYDIDITGHNIIITGPSTAVGNVSAPNVTFNPPATANTGTVLPEGFGEYFTWDRFMIGGDIYNAALAANRLVYTDQQITETWLQNSCTMNGVPCFLDGVLQDGLYITTNATDPAFKIQGNGVHGDGGAFDHANVTVVSDVGGLALTGNQNLINPYIGNASAAGTTAFLTNFPGMLLITFGQGSDQCKDDIISFSGTSSDFGGHIYAPNGKIQFAASNTLIKGCMTGNTIDISQSNNTIICDPTWFPSDLSYLISLEE